MLEMLVSERYVWFPVKRRRKRVDLCTRFWIETAIIVPLFEIGYKYVSKDSIADNDV
jgi:hypothetical protein